MRAQAWRATLLVALALASGCRDQFVTVAVDSNAPTSVAELDINAVFGAPATGVKQTFHVAPDRPVPLSTTFGLRLPAHASGPLSIFLNGTDGDGAALVGQAGLLLAGTSDATVHVLVVPQHCVDRMLDADEAAVDCGGSCRPCAALDALRADGPAALHVDGNLDDWPSAAFVPINHNTAAVADGTWQGTSADDADLSATFAAAWDDQALYVAAAISDDVRALHQTNLYYLDDAIELFLDGNDDRSATPGSDDHQYIARADGAVERYDGVATIPSPALDPGVVVAVQPGAIAKWVVEMSIPWSLLGSSPVTPGRQLGFDLIFDDDDNPDPATQALHHRLIWINDVAGTTCTEPHACPPSFGTVILRDR